MPRQWRVQFRYHPLYTLLFARILRYTLPTACTAIGERCHEWRWAACITSDGITRSGGALFLDLPANMLGCFIMGALSSSSDVPGVKNMPVAIFGSNKWLQQAKALHLGLRTGLCGSLTTFSSWCVPGAKFPETF
jgi:hypothetical protein